MRRLLLPAIFAIAIATGCTCHDTIEVATASPEGPQQDFPTFVRFQLSKPLYDASQPLPKHLPQPKAVVKPAVPFRVSISSPYTVDVDFAQALGPAQDYEVTLKGGLLTADGKGELKAERTVRFRTPLNAVRSLAIHDAEGRQVDVAFVTPDGKLAEPLSTLGPKEGLALQLRFPIPAEQLSLVKVYVKDGQPVPAEVTRDEEQKDRVRIVPRASWPRDAALVVSVDKGLRAEGKGAGTLGSAAAQAFEVHSWGALTVAGPAGSGCVSTKTLPITFANPVACEASLAHLSIDAEGTGFKCVSDQTQRSQRYELAPPPPTDRELHVTLSEGLADAFGETSKGVQTFAFTACESQVQFAYTKPFVILDPGQSAEAVERLHGAKSLKIEGKKLALPEVWTVLKDQKLADQVAWTELPWWLQYGDEGWGDEEGGGEEGGHRKPGELDGPVKELEGAQSLTLPVTGEKEWNDVSIPLDQFLGGKKGLVILRETPLGDNGQPSGRPVLRVANVTDIGLSARLSRDTLVVLAAKYSDGKPYAGVKLAVRSEDGQALGEGITGDDGLLRLPANLANQAGSEVKLLVVATKDDDEAFLWSKFVVDGWWSGGKPELVGLAYTDRGIYKPGEKGHLRAVMRFASAKGFDSVAGQSAHLLVQDEEDTEILSADLVANDYGAIEKDLEIPASAKVGTWRYEVTVGDGRLSGSFQVGEFRRAEMKVEIQAPPTLAWGQSLKAVVQGDYLFGAPAGGLDVRWNLTRTPTAFRSERLPEAKFADPTREEWGWYEHDGETTLAEGAGKLDQNGSFVLAQPMKLPNPVSQREIVTISASVDDASGQSVSRLAQVDLFAGKVLVGLEGGSYLAKANEPYTITAVAVTPDDQLAPDTAIRVSTRESTWRSVRRSGPGGGYYWTSERVEKNDVTRCEGRTDANGRLSCTFTPEMGGSLQIVAETKDPSGRVLKAGVWRWVYGDPQYFGASSDTPQVGVLLEKDTVDAGQTAKIALTSPFHDAVALVTVEREDVLWQKAFPIGTSAVLDIPTDPSWAPNVHVVATVVRGRMNPGEPPDPEKEKPQYAIGRKELKIRPKEANLEVKVSVASARLEPGQQQTATVDVQTAKGAAAEAEVNLWAVDEGVLMLTGYKTPNLLASMFRTRGNRTLGLDTRAYVLGKRVFVEPVIKGEEDGGGGGDEADAKTRRNFDPVAVWVGSAITDAQGRITKAFNVPDNLTTYRVMAVVASKDDRFGSGDAQFKVNKPLMLRQALARFARPGDALKAGVLVNQLTDTAGTVTVSLDALDEKLFQLSGPRSVEVEVKPGTTVPVLFDLTARDVEGSSKLVFSAKLGTHQDKVELPLPVKRQTPREAVAASGVVAANGKFAEALQLPEQARAESLEMNVSGFPVSAMESRLRDMVGYPYGCLEQKTSKVLPLLAIRKLAEDLQMKSIPTDQIKGWVEEYISIIPRYRCADDGFDYWPGCRFGASTILSGYALEGMLTAKKYGFQVPQQEIDRTVAFLKKMVRSGSQGMDQYGGDGLVDHQFVGALRVLAEAGQPEPEIEKARFDQRADMPLFAKTDLTRAMASHLGKDAAQDANVKTLLDEIGKSGKEKDGSLTYDAEDPKRYWWAWESGQRNTALVLRTLLQVVPADGRIPLLVKGLIDLDRSSDYYITSDTTQTLLGLADAVARLKPDGALKASVSAAGQKLGDETLGATVKTWSVPGDKLSGSIPLEIANTGSGPVFFGAYLNYAYPATARLPASAHGFTLTREYLGQDGKPLPLVQTDAGKVLKLNVGDYVKVRITAKVDDEGRLVVIEDPLPAGLEAVDTNLATADVQAVKKLNGENAPDWWSSYHREIRDDRVEWHYQEIWRDNLELSYVARATSAGTFYAPGTHAERMYQPHINGRSDGLVVQVAAKAK